MPSGRKRCLVARRFPAIALVLLLAACTAMKPVPGNLTVDSIRGQIKPGDEVIVVTKTSKDRIVVDSISRNAITGSGKRFPIADIVEIDKKGISPLKTTALVAGGWGVYETVAVIGFLGLIIAL